MSLSVNGRVERKINTTNNLAKKNNVILVIFLIVCVQINALNCDNQPHGGFPNPSGSGWQVSEEKKSDFFLLFFYVGEMDLVTDITRVISFGFLFSSPIPPVWGVL